MMRHSVIRLLLVIFFIQGAVGKTCGQPEVLKNYREVMIKTSGGRYVSADRKKNNQLVANRSQPGEWERFTVKVLENNAFALLASNWSYVAYSDNIAGILQANNPAPGNNASFTVVVTDTGWLYLATNLNTFVRIDSNGYLKYDALETVDATMFFVEPVPQRKRTHFSGIQLLPLITGLLFVFLSVIVFQYRDDKRLSLVLLLLGGFCVRLFTALLNEHLHLWDEQYHALVAKNMISHPFSPMLYANPVLDHDYRSWVEGSLWLHKQPLFLWQMALSLNIFGINAFAVRLPSVIMSTVIIWFIYRMGSLTVGKTAGFYAALLFAMSNFALEMAAGVYPTDHNDVAFLFYVTASVWAWVEYEHADVKRKRLFLVLIGLFSGCAVLVKWLTGLLVFLGWGIAVLLIKQKRRQLTSYLHIGISAAIAAAVFIPWQVYILTAFPLESRYEYALVTNHFFNVVEEHGGTFWFHFDAMKRLYGINGFILMACLVFFFVALKERVHKIGFAAFFIAIYLFYSIASTKMPAFTWCIAFIPYLAGGVVLERFFRLLILNPEVLSGKIYRVIYTTLVLGVVSGYHLHIEKIQENHTMWKKDETTLFFQRITITPEIKNLPQKLHGIENFVLFNCPKEEMVPVMFFTDIAAAYSIVPDSGILLRLQQKGLKAAVVDNGYLPHHLLTHDDIVLVDIGLRKIVSPSVDQ